MRGSLFLFNVDDINSTVEMESNASSRTVNRHRIRLQYRFYSHSNGKQRLFAFPIANKCVVYRFVHTKSLHRM